MGNVLLDALNRESAWANMVQAEMGYERKTTFYSDFTIADAFGNDAIEDTYNRSEYWLSNLEHGTELVLVLNHKSWEWQKDKERCALYVRLYEKAYDLLLEKHRGNEKAMDYIFNTLD